MIICPKCSAKGSDIVLREFWRDHGIEFDQKDDGAIEEDGVLYEGSPYRVRGTCFGCGHNWTLRAVMQITDLVGYPK